ncbi:MAG TPA: cyclic nucleotide-binding domain-containing protein, partial [Spirochaetia bacterium]|nr:cyclic nucleotide-binding domain-containing protein [Spirochaetia bacterium]
MPELEHNAASPPAKQTLLERVSLFRELRPEELELIAAYSDLVHFSDGETIFTHGTNGESLYIVSGGAVRIIADGTGTGQDIARFIGGELFGELDLFEESVRTVDAVAEGRTDLLIFPRPG